MDVATTDAAPSRNEELRSKCLSACPCCLSSPRLSRRRQARPRRQPVLYRGEYSLSFLGISVARATFDSRVDDKTYAIKGAVSASGLAALFYDTKGTISASGVFSGEATRPGHFRADYVYGEKATLVDISFAGGNVTRTTNVPALRQRGNWVPLGPHDLQSVADPIAAMLVRADSPRDVCRRTVKLYDGDLRADLAMAYVKTGTVMARGYQGATVTCSVKFTPVAGYRKNRRTLEFLRTKGRMMVAFAPAWQIRRICPRPRHRGDRDRHHHHAGAALRSLALIERADGARRQISR